MPTRSRLFSLMLGACCAITPVLSAQTAVQTSPTTPVGAEINLQRSMVTRQELESALAQIERDINSPGYSEAVRAPRQAEAQAIRQRLDDGDIQAGDIIKVAVLSNGAFSREYVVSPLRTIKLPGGAEISVAHKLRSELSEHLAREFAAYLVDPKVTATASIRLQISGAVGRNGFYWAPASDLLQSVLMEQGGGPTRDANLGKSQILRGEKIVINGPEFQTALHEGKTLDALNVQAGDEIRVAEKPAGGMFLKVLGVASALGSVIFLARSIF